MSVTLRLDSIVNINSNVSLLPNGVRSLEVTQLGRETISFLTSVVAHVGQLVSIQGKVKLENQTHPFVATGKIVGVTANDDSASCVEVRLHQFDEELWNNIRHTLDAKQARADWLFKNIKGLD